MFLYRRILVGDQERVLLIRKGRFVRILNPGEYWVWGPGNSLKAEKHNVQKIVFESEWSDFLAKEKQEVAEQYFKIVETNDSQAAVVSVDAKLFTIVPPGKRMLFWREPADIRVLMLNIAEKPEVPEDLVIPVSRVRPDLAGFTTVEQEKVGLLFHKGRFVRSLDPGPYGFWNAAGISRVEIVDLRLQTLEIPGQEILTADKVSIRVNISAEFQVTDAVQAKQTLKDFNVHLYRTLQLAVRQTLGKRTLEQILAEKVDVDETVASSVRREMQNYSVRVGTIALKDIVLPGDMREILNQVVTAEKQAQANLIRRREETAATRSLLNTAKLMDENPLLIRLKELETLEKVSEKVAKITVHGGFNTLLKRMFTLRSKDKDT
jgi:regulator of protease activity HflC (stomatin/prohibitin superfamily)